MANLQIKGIDDKFYRLIRLTAVNASGHQGFWRSKINKIIFDIKSLLHNNAKFSNVDVGIRKNDTNVFGL